MWNQNGYFWESKSVHKWAEDRLKGIFNDFQMQTNAGLFSVVKVEKFKGEASCNIRKGKKLVAYDYEVNLNWQVVMKDGDGKVVDTVKGDMHWPDISNTCEEDGDEFEANLILTEGEKHRDRVYPAIKGKVIGDMRAEIVKFVRELRDK